MSAIKVTITRIPADDEGGCQGCRAVCKSIAEMSHNDGRDYKIIDTIIRVDIDKSLSGHEVGLYSLRLCDECWGQFREDFAEAGAPLVEDAMEEMLDA